MESRGLSIVVCCHNSAERLPDTLPHIFAQKTTSFHPWEIIVIDNASTDETAAVAYHLCKTHCVPFRIVREERRGLVFARERGLAEAKYQFVSFVDDDNWLAEDWVEIATRFLEDHPAVGAVGGSSTAVFEGDPPSWFSACQHMFAVSPESWRAGQKDLVWGAGLTVRKRAWLDVSSTNIPFFTTGRVGRSMAGGEDVELCYRLTLAGWSLWYEPRLRLRHYMPQERLTWKYARRLHRGAGEAGALLSSYNSVLSSNFRRRNRSHSWSWLLLSCLKSLARHPWGLSLTLLGHEGDPFLLGLELRWGYLVALARNRRSYYQRQVIVEELRNVLGGKSDSRIGLNERRAIS